MIQKQQSLETEKIRVFSLQRDALHHQAVLRRVQEAVCNTGQITTTQTKDEERETIPPAVTLPRRHVDKAAMTSRTVSPRMGGGGSKCPSSTRRTRPGFWCCWNTLFCATDGNSIFGRKSNLHFSKQDCSRESRRHSRRKPVKKPSNVV